MYLPAKDTFFEKNNKTFVLCEVIHNKVWSHDLNKKLFAN